MVACVSQRLSDEFVNLSVSERIARMNRSESQPLSNQHPSMTQPHYGTISKKSKAPVIPTSASMATSQKVYYSQVPLESDCKSPTVKLSRSQSAVSCRRQKLVRRPSVAPPLPPSHSGRITAQCWYHGNLDRQNATEKLINFAKDGGFLVRNHSKCHSDVPYTLSLYCQKKVYHLEIRKLPDGQYAIGKPTAGEQHFKTLHELITHHSKVPLTLLSRKLSSDQKISCTTCLTESLNNNL